MNCTSSIQDLPSGHRKRSIYTAHKRRLTRSPIQGSFGPSQGQEASFLQVLCGQVAGDGGRPHTLLPHQVTVFKECWGRGKNVNSSLPENSPEDKLNSHCPAPQEAFQALLVCHGDLIKTAQGSVVRGTGLNTGHAVPWVSASSPANCQKFQPVNFSK